MCRTLIGNWLSRLGEIPRATGNFKGERTRKQVLAYIMQYKLLLLTFELSEGPYNSMQYVAVLYATQILIQWLWISMQCIAVLCVQHMWRWAFLMASVCYLWESIVPLQVIQYCFCV